MKIKVKELTAGEYYEVTTGTEFYDKFVVEVGFSRTFTDIPENLTKNELKDIVQHNVYVEEGVIYLDFNSYLDLIVVKKDFEIKGTTPTERENYIAMTLEKEFSI